MRRPRLQASFSRVPREGVDFRRTPFTMGRRLEPHTAVFPSDNPGCRHESQPADDLPVERGPAAGGLRLWRATPPFLPTRRGLLLSLPGTGPKAYQPSTLRHEPDRGDRLQPGM